MARTGSASSLRRTASAPPPFTKALADFKQGDVRVLVATDIAARGLDIEQLPHVVNYELPNVSEDYVHRIGRTGRAGSDGTAISLVCVDERQLLSDIERLIKRPIPKKIIAGYEPDPSIPAEPILNGRSHSQSRPRKNQTPREYHSPARRPTPAPKQTSGGNMARFAGYSLKTN